MASPSTEPSPRLVVVLNERDLTEIIQTAVAELIADSTPRTEALLDGPEMCRILGVSSPTLRKMRAAGCPYHSLGESVRYRASEVLAWTRRAPESDAENHCA